MTIKRKRDSKIEKRKSNSTRSSLETDISSPKAKNVLVVLPVTIDFNNK